MHKGLVFVGMGFELLGLVIGALYLGQIIDKYMGWSGYAVAGLLIVVMISWVLHLVVLLKRFIKDMPDDPQI